MPKYGTYVAPPLLTLGAHAQRGFDYNAHARFPQAFNRVVLDLSCFREKPPFLHVNVVVCIKIYQRNNENTVLHELRAQPYEAYGIADVHKVTVQSNETYVTDAKPNEAYGVTDVHKVTVQSNDTYMALQMYS